MAARSRHDAGGGRMTRLRFCVTGATGFIGRRLVAAIHEQGYSVSILSRRAAPDFPVAVRVCQGDLAEPGSNLAPFLQGCDVVLHCAAELRNVALMQRLHVEGTARLLQAIRKESVQRGREIHFVQLSSVGVYGPPTDRNRARVVQEDAPCRPLGDYETTKCRADELLREAAEPGVMTHAILRPSIVFGAGMPNASLRALIAMVRRGLFFYIGKRPAMTNYVHVDDVVAAMLKLACEAKAKGQTYNLSSDCPLDQLIQRIATVFGVRPPTSRLPERAVRMAVKLFAALPRMPLTASRIDALVNQTSYPAEKIVQELGFVFSRPMPDAIEDLADEVG